MVSSWDLISGIYKKESKIKNILVRGNKSFTSFTDDVYFKEMNASLDFHEVMISSGVVSKAVLDLLITRVFDQSSMSYRFFVFCGGAVIDYTKHLILYGLNNAYVIDNFITIPTTAGSGSERTSFAVIFDKLGNKKSVQDKRIKPNHVYYKPDVLASATIDINLSSGLDAICQAIESLWSVSSTKESRLIANTSLALGVKYLPQVLKGNTKSYLGMLTASRMSGEAINITKTTAAHAYSYYLTYVHKIPHGIAVSMVLIGLLNHVKDQDVNMHDNIASYFAAYDYTSFADFINKIGLSTRDYKKSLKNMDDKAFLSAVNKERLSNYPYSINEEELIKSLKSI